MMKPVHWAYIAATGGSLLVFAAVLSALSGSVQYYPLLAALMGAVLVSFILIFVATFKLTVPEQEVAK